MGLVLWCVGCGGGAVESAQPKVSERARVFESAEVRVPWRRARRAREPVPDERGRWVGDSWRDYDCEELGYFTHLVDADAGGSLAEEEMGNPLMSCAGEANYDACIVRRVRERVDCVRRCEDAAWVLGSPRSATPERERLAHLFARLCASQ